ncbi:4Fe-4S ferredoxin [Rhodococcus sp. ACS1]|uniref:ferredoxin n=1 Tax=Rhodococcus sp. ACS1 TaxID=2028570 RepID=UPI000BB10106|nr:ferredoxin [Rhodococcus sp. ACS1]PBC35682.1 4Fe-4S ferredoxin [Rhodococcus sp. ACS1]
MKIYVDQIECTGSGQCEQIAPRFFTVLDTGLATVVDDEGRPLLDGGAGVGTDVPEASIGEVRDAIDVCPGACIREIAREPH